MLMKMIPILQYILSRLMVLCVHHSINIKIEEPYQDNKLLPGGAVSASLCVRVSPQRQQPADDDTDPCQHWSQANPAPHDFPATHSQATTSGF